MAAGATVTAEGCPNTGATAAGAARAAVKVGATAGRNSGAVAAAEDWPVAGCTTADHAPGGWACTEGRARTPGSASASLGAGTTGSSVGVATSAGADPASAVVGGTIATVGVAHTGSSAARRPCVTIVRVVVSRTGFDVADGTIVAGAAGSDADATELGGTELGGTELAGTELAADDCRATGCCPVWTASSAVGTEVG